MKRGMTSDAGIEFLKVKEGFTEFADHILDEERLTIGHGHVVKPGEKWKLGDRITRDEADTLLREDVKIAEEDVKKIIPNWHKLSANEFDALVSLLLNAGRGNVKDTRAIAALNKALKGDERDQREIEKFLFEAFDADAGITKRTNAEGKLVKSKGLVNRRAAERRLFLKGK